MTSASSLQAPCAPGSCTPTPHQRFRPWTKMFIASAWKCTGAPVPGANKINEAAFHNQRQVCTSRARFNPLKVNSGARARTC